MEKDKSRRIPENLLYVHLPAVHAHIHSDHDRCNIQKGKMDAHKAPRIQEQPSQKQKGKGRIRRGNIIKEVRAEYVNAKYIHPHGWIFVSEVGFKWGKGQCLRQMKSHLNISRISASHKNNGESLCNLTIKRKKYLKK